MLFQSMLYLNLNNYNPSEYRLSFLIKINMIIILSKQTRF
jgi:hypothetical protein